MTPHMASFMTAALLLTACQTVSAGSVATVDLGDPETRAAVAQTLGQALGRARVELGPTGSPTTSVVTVLPPPPGPHETHALAVPITFDIVWRDGQCIAISRDKAKVVPLPVDCRE